MALTWEAVGVRGTRVRAGDMEYTFDGALPASARAGGREALSAPIRLLARFGGERMAWGQATVNRADGEAVEIHEQCMADNLILDARTRVEDDGLAWCDLMLIPFGCYGRFPRVEDGETPRLTAVTLEARLPREVARLYHYWPAGDNSSVQTGVTYNSGALTDDGLSLGHKPVLWLGREEAGLAVYMESDENMRPEGAFAEVCVEGEEAVLRLHLLDGMPECWRGRHDAWGDALEPIRFSLGFQLTPVKPYRRNADFDHCFHSDFRLIEPMSLERFDEHCANLAAHGVKWHTLHEDWTAVQNYGLPGDEARFGELVRIAHRHGIKVMVYFGYECATSAPGWWENRGDWTLRDEHGRLNGGWQRMPPQRDYMVCYAGGYADVLLGRVERAMRVYGVDGVYLDSTIIPVACANASHGCGYAREDGTRARTFPLRAARSLIRRLSAIVHERGGLVEGHQSSCCMPMLMRYVDGYFDGEHIQGAFAKDPANFLDEGMLRAEFSGVNFGVPLQMLSLTGDFETGCAVTLLVGALPKVYGTLPVEKLDGARRVWGVLDGFGWLDAEFFPFWRSDSPAKADDPRVRCAAWRRADGALLAVFVNLSPESVEVRASVDGRARTLTLPAMKPVFVNETGERA